MGAGVAVIAAAVFFAYLPAARGSWLWDDLPELTQNSEITGDTGLAAIWIEPSTADYFPLKSTVQWIGWRLWYDNVIGWHALNGALHFVSALLVWRLFLVLRVSCAWLGGLIFAVHPLSVESVAWIAELKNTVSLPLLLLTAIAYVQFERSSSLTLYFAALFFFLGSLLAKTSGVMLPGVFLIYLWWRQRLTIRSASMLAPFFAVALILGWVTVQFQHQRAIGEWHIELGGILWRATLASSCLGFYIEKFFIPFGLSPVYPKWEVQLWSFRPYLFPLIAITTFLLCRKLVPSSSRSLGFALGAFILLVAPVIGFVAMSYMHYAWVADHFVYAPIIPLAALLTTALGRLIESSLVVIRGVGFVAVAIISLSLLGMSHAYAKFFQGDIPFWTYTLIHNPKAWVAHNNLGKALQEVGRMTEAREHYDAAIAGDATYAEPLNNLGTWFDRLGQPTEALIKFQSALRLKPSFALAFNNIGNEYVRLGRHAEAITAYRSAIAAEPDLAEAHANLANALYLNGDSDAAIGEYRQAISMNKKSVTAYQNLARVELRLGRVREAIHDLKRAAKIAPENAGLQNDLGFALIADGRLEDAEKCCRAAILLDPQNLDAHINLGGILYRRGQSEQAIQEYERALQISPTSVEAQRNLKALGRRGDP